MGEYYTIHWSQTHIQGHELLRALPSVVAQSLEGRTPVRATVLTLGLYVKGGRSQDWAALAGQIARVHPARILVINATEIMDCEPLLDAEISAVLNGKNQAETPVLFSECIQMNLQGSLNHHWIDLVQPLINSDLPAYLWWLHERPPQPDFRWDLLKTGFTHFVMDSRGTGLETWFPAIARARSHKVHVADLNWHRLEVWRSQWADVADTPEGLALFRHPEHIVIETPQASAGEWELLMGWLAHQLEWTYRHHPESPSANTAEGLPIAIEVRPGPHLKVTLCANNLCLFTVQDGSRTESEMRAGADVINAWSAPEPPVDTCNDFIRMLNRGYDRLYEQAMDVLNPPQTEEV